MINFSKRKESLKKKNSIPFQGDNTVTKDKVKGQYR